MRERALGCRIATSSGWTFCTCRTSPAGISAATNRGLEQVRTPYAAVTHDDCRVRHDWLERLAARLAEIGDDAL